MREYIRTITTTSIAFIVSCTCALAAGKLAYGSRVGMDVTVVGIENPGTERAVIRAKHTREDARAFCTEYLNDRSRACVDSAMRSTILSDTIRANCRTGVFTTFYGETMKFRGINPKRKNEDTETKYIVVKGGEILDGSSASGYDVALSQFAALCPGRVLLGQ